tara:strand:+ start:87 stop:632 length:546 start_codon:yes stop_codon:yes gene_type:complete
MRVSLNKIHQAADVAGQASAGGGLAQPLWPGSGFAVAGALLPQPRFLGLQPLNLSESGGNFFRQRLNLRAGGIALFSAGIVRGFGCLTGLALALKLALARIKPLFRRLQILRGVLCFSLQLFNLQRELVAAFLQRLLSGAAREQLFADTGGLQPLLRFVALQGSAFAFAFLLPFPNGNLSR